MYRVAAMGWGYALHAEQIAVPFRLCVRLPDNLSFEHAVLADLAATALHAAHSAPAPRSGPRARLAVPVSFAPDPVGVAN
jgi:threonine dehydrogenase-like Zn-dependent dehydrogenase